MSNNVSNLRDTIVPKSDQLNAEQLYAGAITITVTQITRGSSDQPVIIHYAGEDGRPYKPCKSMRKVLIFAWGEDGNKCLGRSMTLFCDHAVKWGGIAVGGIRISHLSDIDREISVSLTTTRGKKEPFIVKKLIDPSDSYKNIIRESAKRGSTDLQSAWKDLPKGISGKLGADFLEEQKIIAVNVDKEKSADSGHVHIGQVIESNPSSPSNDGEKPEELF